MLHQPVPAERYFNGPALIIARACQHDDPGAVTQALVTTHVSPDAVGEQGMSLLLLAMSNRSKKAVLALLQHGANPNLRTELGQAQVSAQPVGLAAGGDDTELLTLLLDHGGDPNSVFEDPALVCATNADRYDHMRLLLDRGADINATEKDGTPLLVQLAMLKQFEQVAYLIKRGADIHKTDHMGGTVAFEVQNVRHELPEPMEHWNERVIHLLQARGVRFPVPHPGVAYHARIRAENAQRRQWEATAEGGAWINPIRVGDQAAELGQQSDNDRSLMMTRRQEAEPAFQAWRKTQPHWSPTTNDGGTGYVDPPTLEEEAADIARGKALLQQDSARWAKPAPPTTPPTGN